MYLSASSDCCCVVPYAATVHDELRVYTNVAHVRTALYLCYHKQQYKREKKLNAIWHSNKEMLSYCPRFFVCSATNLDTRLWPAGIAKEEARVSVIALTFLSPTTSF